MAEGQGSATFHIICSNRPRNGKTLFARLLADYLILCERAPLIFEVAAAAGDIAAYFPIPVIHADLSTTAGQMALFDRALGPRLQDCVLDLPTHLSPTFLGVSQHIGFIDAARANGLKVLIHFVVDRDDSSLLAGRKLRADIGADRFIAVRNEAIAPSFADAITRARYDDLARDGRIIIPALASKALKIVEGRTFSFSRFAQENVPELPADMRKAITSFLTYVYRQFDLLSLETGFGEFWQGAETGKARTAI